MSENQAVPGAAFVFTLSDNYSAVVMTQYTSSGRIIIDPEMSFFAYTQADKGVPVGDTIVPSLIEKLFAAGGSV